jgi:pimeloyl-ACP methyl ester carboxylesterase
MEEPMSAPGNLETNARWSLPKKQLLRRVLKPDPRQEYFVYVPSTGGQDAPLFVSVHGLSRNTREQGRLFSGYCESRGVVLVAPRFSRREYGDYQRLGRAGLGSRADLALHAIVEEVALLTGASASQIYLFGFSGGAQFAHRYTMAHPQRVVRAVIVSAGWYTFPDARRRFPYGIRPIPALTGVRFDPEEFLRVPITVLVGDQDGTNGTLRHSKRLDSQQGVTRVERARNWVSAMIEAANAYHMDPQVSFEQVGGTNHSFKQFMNCGALGEKVFEALFRRSVFSVAGDGAKEKAQARG